MFTHEVDINITSIVSRDYIHKLCSEKGYVYSETKLGQPQLSKDTVTLTRLAYQAIKARGNSS